ncbi:assembly of actin patch protein [Collariella sp. IMI 366227]|nr:assembly of actin patch protein [Collariella sp. IMI 366227]
MSFKVKAIYDYASGHEDDLNFSIGQIITVTDEDDDDWYGGEYIDDAGTKQEGIFPRNFVEKYEPTAPPRPTRTRPKKEVEHPSGPPPVTEKPSSSSFKDRIAAFNKAAAPPLTPFKPSGLSSGSAGFIKKPFVPPPPSRNAYVPTPVQAPVAKLYRRDEDPEVKEQEAETLENAGKVGLVHSSSTNEGEAAEDQPKPLSLKERLALLQKQQAETAARHAEAAAKKEKPKRPPKKRLDSQDTIEGEPAERIEETRASTDEPHPPRLPHPPRRKSSRGAEPRDGNEADMSGAGETTEQEEHLEKDDSDHRPRHVASLAKQEDEAEDEEEYEEEDEDDVDPEIRRREELRARMAKMSGGMGMPGMAMPLFGAPAPILPRKKKAAPERVPEECRPKSIALLPLFQAEDQLHPLSPRSGVVANLMKRVQRRSLQSPLRLSPPAKDRCLMTNSLSALMRSLMLRSSASAPPATAAPPPIPTSPRASQDRRPSYIEEPSSTSPRESKRNSRPPPPIPGSPPAPPPAQTRPFPPPPSAAPPLLRTSTDLSRAPPPPVPVMHRVADDVDEEVTEYEGDYDTDIASSVPHKDALKAHQKEPSIEEATSARSPTVEVPPIPTAAPPRAGPPPVPSQPPRRPGNPWTCPGRLHRPPPREPTHHEEEPFVIRFDPQIPPPPPSGRAPARQSVDLQRGGFGRRSVDMARPSLESGFVANDIDLASQSGWWLQPKGLPPQLHGRKDIFFESEESSTADSHKTIITRDIYVLFQDYSQTIITVSFNPADSSDVHVEQTHKPPPRALRQDQLEKSYERFGRAIGEAAAARKDTVVGDGAPHALVYDLLRPFRDALLPVGTRAYGALVYSNLANASTTQNDEIRPGDIVSIRNAKFQGKHGAMHAKYSMEVGKPDHVGVVAEWDGTKKKVKAWEQGRESRKVKLESFKLDDLRSGEVKIWRVMPRSWIGWEPQAGGGGAGAGAGGAGGN